MLEYMRFVLILVFVAGLSSCEEYNCIYYEYKKSTGIMVMKCGEGCTGEPPNCEPHCDTKCPIRSKCTKPNVCECDAGYRMTNETESNQNQSCQPICGQGCFNNAYCASPNVCECPQGYTEVTNIEGIVESCLVIKKNTFTGIHIVIYSLLICSSILLTIAGICMLIVLIKRKSLRRSHGNSRNFTSSWRTSFASYTANEGK